MFNYIKKIWSSYKTASAINNRYHVSSIIYLVAILVVLGVALMYTELLNNSVFVDMPGIGKLLRLPRVNAVMGSLGSWLGVPNINEALLLVIVSCIITLVAIFILRIVVGGVMGWLFVFILATVGRACYKAVLNYNTGADILYENNLLGIHITRILGETERMDIIKVAVEEFFARYEINEGVILTQVTPGDIVYLLDVTSVEQTKQQIIQAVHSYLHDTHMSFETYPSLQQELGASSWSWVNEWVYSAGGWCYAHPYIVAGVITTVCVCIWYSQGGYYGESINKLAEGVGENLTSTNQVVNTSATNTSEAQNEMILGMQEVMAEIKSNKEQIMASLGKQNHELIMKLQAQNADLTTKMNALQQGLDEVKTEANTTYHIVCGHEGKWNTIFDQNRNMDERMSIATELIASLGKKILN